MVRIVLDKEMQKRLLVSDELIELFDESGKLLGRILPYQEDSLAGWEPITREVGEEEYQRRLQSDGPTISTPELLDRLKGKA